MCAPRALTAACTSLVSPQFAVRLAALTARRPAPYEHLCHTSRPFSPTPIRHYSGHVAGLPARGRRAGSERGRGTSRRVGQDVRPLVENSRRATQRQDPDLAKKLSARRSESWCHLRLWGGGGHDESVRLLAPSVSMMTFTSHRWPWRPGGTSSRLPIAFWGVRAWDDTDPLPRLPPAAGPQGRRERSKSKVERAKLLVFR